MKRAFVISAQATGTFSGGPFARGDSLGGVAFRVGDMDPVRGVLRVLVLGTGIGIGTGRDRDGIPAADGL
jgi:hypothetical protein